MRLPFVTSDYSRRVSGAPDLLLRNRYFETNPTLTEDGASLLPRPGLKYFTTVGQGPIRGIKSESGSFNGDLFVASGTEVYRVSADGSSRMIYTGLGNASEGFVTFAITANIENVPPYCFIADGSSFLVYIENGYATNTLSGTIANNDVVRIGATYYQFTNGSVDAGTPNGSVSNPWLVALGVNNMMAFSIFASAVNGTGVAGVDYSTNLQVNGEAAAINLFTESVQVRATTPGVSGNSIVTTTTGSNLTWANGGTLTGGGEESVLPVGLPIATGVISCAVINSFVVVVPEQSGSLNGRFYWIEPGELFVNALNFATAESAPDGLNGVVVFKDQFWLSGESTTEVWYFTGDLNVPVRRVQGVLFDRGTLQNMAVPFEEGIVLTDSLGGVFLVSGGEPRRISTPAIEEQLRRALIEQRRF
jgi:hypothetical protein